MDTKKLSPYLVPGLIVLLIGMGLFYAGSSYGYSRAQKDLQTSLMQGIRSRFNSQSSNGSGSQGYGGRSQFRNQFNQHYQPITAPSPTVDPSQSGTI